MNRVKELVLLASNIGWNEDTINYVIKTYNFKLEDVENIIKFLRLIWSEQER